MPAGIFLLQGRIQSAIPRRAPAPLRASALPAGWSLILSQPLSAVSFQRPCISTGSIFSPCLQAAGFPSAFSASVSLALWQRMCAHTALRQPSSSAVSGFRRIGAAFIPFSIHRDRLRQRPWLPRRPPRLRAAAAARAAALAVPPCGSHHRPSTSHRRFIHASANQHPFVPLVILLRQNTGAAPAMTQVSRPSPSSSRGFRLRPFRPTFIEEEGRTPHSRQQVISSAPGPWALRGIPLRAGWHEH